MIKDTTTDYEGAASVNATSFISAAGTSGKVRKSRAKRLAAAGENVNAQSQLLPPAGI